MSDALGVHISEHLRREAGKHQKTVMTVTFYICRKLSYPCLELGPPLAPVDVSPVVALLQCG